ncbi:MAG: OmpA family protein [Desulforhopalus sp.]|nr:OmpA family protein [Desulforhopalus sp.]
MKKGMNKRFSFWQRSFGAILVILIGSMLLAGCVKRAKPLTRPALDTPMSLEVAVRMIAFDLFAQISNQQKPAKKTLAEKMNAQQNQDDGKQPLVFSTDVVMNADTGEEIELSAQINEIIKATAGNSFPKFTVVEMNSTNIDQTNFVIIGVIKQEIYNNQPTKLPRLYLSAVDMKTGQVLAHSDVWFSQQDLKLLPTPLYSDSPMFIKDTRSEKVIATAQANAGVAVDKEYLATMATNALLAEASKAYDSGNYPLAIELFNKAAAREDGQVMKTYAGLYQAYWKQKLMAEAEGAFGKLAELGIRNGTLSVKFLFQVNDTNFFGQPEELAEYDIWLRQIAKKIIESQSCVEISGHASHSGSADYNKKLSDKRAHKIQKRLLDVSSAIAKKTSAVGRGFEENIVGTGTDDIRDAIDRRVVFRVLDCGAL